MLEINTGGGLKLTELICLDFNVLIVEQLFLQLFSTLVKFAVQFKFFPYFNLNKLCKLIYRGKQTKRLYKVTGYR